MAKGEQRTRPAPASARAGRVPATTGGSSSLKAIGGGGRRRPRWRAYEYAFMGPTLAFVAIMLVLPLAYTFYLSLHRWTGGLTSAPEFVGAANFRSLAMDRRFHGAVFTTLLFAMTALVAQTLLGLAYAMLLNRQFLGRGLARTLLLLPMTATPVAVALIWRLLYQPDLGLINQLLRPIGVGPIEWLSNPSVVLWSLVVADTWQWTPLIAIIVLAGLSALPTEPQEAALVDGASSWQAFRYVTLPLLRPVLMVAVTIRAIDALKTFDLILVLTGGGPGFASETVNVFAYRTTFVYQQLGYSGAVLTAFLVLIGALAALLLSARRNSDLIA